jgi:predicted O-methyltransferase YrrM
VTTVADEPRSPAPQAFDEVFAQLVDVKGWMSREQARRLWDGASVLAAGERVVEIGSLHGRSTIVLASSAPPGVELIAIDPHGGNDRGPQEIDGFETEAQDDFEQFHANLRAAGVHERVTHLRQFSSAALAQVKGPVQLLYIDGAHRYRPALADIRRWGERVADGGTMLIHDSFSSVGVTLALVSSTFLGPSFRYIGRSGSMTEYRRVRLTPKQRVGNALRQVAQLPWFARNVLVKVGIVAKLHPLYRALGSDGTWPY